MEKLRRRAIKEERGRRVKLLEGKSKLMAALSGRVALKAQAMEY